MEKENKKYRINIFEQLNEFYKIMFNDQDKLNISEISLYMFLLYMNNKLNWCEWFRLPFDLIINGSGIGSNVTYYKALKKLQNKGLIMFVPGVNKARTVTIKIIKLFKNKRVDTPLSEVVNIQLDEELADLLYNVLPTELNAHIYKEFNNKLKYLIKNKKNEIKKGNFSILIRNKF